MASIYFSFEFGLLASTLSPFHPFIHSRPRAEGGGGGQLSSPSFVHIRVAFSLCQFDYFRLPPFAAKSHPKKEGGFCLPPSSFCPILPLHPSNILLFSPSQNKVLIITSASAALLALEFTQKISN
jgi:hypothetical protein